MNRCWVWGITGLALLASFPILHHRFVQESRDRRVTLAVDWTEFRDLAARQNRRTADWLADLRARGVTSIVLTPMTLGDLYSQHRIGLSAAALDSASLVPEPGLGAQIAVELQRRGASNVRWDDRHLTRTGGTFQALKDIEIGFDLQLVKAVHAAGLKTVFRLNRDPWTPAGDARRMLDGLAGADGVLFISDELPGGLELEEDWRNWLLRTRALQFLIEIHPSKAASLMARALPSQTYRAHTIPVNELKDLSPADQMARWARAVQERMGRLLLVHASSTDSVPSFFDGLSQLSAKLQSFGFVLQFPETHSGMEEFSLFSRLSAWAALLVGIGAPLVGLWLWTGGESLSPMRSFWQISLLTLVWALVAAALADNPLTRLEIVPFRGIKAMFLLSWAGVALLLYQPNELRTFATSSVRRWEILALLVTAAIVGYVVVRSGNASAEWKHPWEQPIRNALEQYLVARPRFKEFLIGHPLLILGLSLVRRTGGWLGRACIALGMMGQISMMNTFCHLHSPLAMELWRTANGLVLGCALGWVALRLFASEEVVR